MNYIIKYLLVLIPAFFYAKAFTQSTNLGEEENKLIGIHTQISSRINGTPGRRYESPLNDSAAYFADALDKGFTSLITGNPGTIDYPFNKLRDSSICHITTSTDGNMRVYNLDTWQLLTQIYQWKGKGKDKVYTKVSRYQKDSSGLCREIFAVPVKGKRYYLPVTSTIIWPKQAMQSVSVWQINGSDLAAVPLFKNKKEKLDHIDVPFSFYNFAPGIKDSLLKFITYDNEQKKIFIPCVNDKGVFTRHYFIYEVKNEGLEFTRIGDMKQEKQEKQEKQKKQERGIVNPPRKKH